ncbi:hypothetical protein PG996_014155 [Apiospora saccharicola]|uniref:SET domain-containing protein n=1 Tax=Apiospora saccharicola TaxID=335842 RepID=A0ABR1THI5_9PEZI
MEVKHISDGSPYATYFKQLFAAAERVASRKGDLVTDHPPAQQLVAEFLFKLQMSSMRKLVMGGQHQLSTTQVPAPYPPCTRTLRDLKPAMISDMKLETHHRGLKTLLRVLTPPDRMNAAMALVEDQEGTAVLLQLYHLPEVSVVPTEHILYKDRVCILKEPFFKGTTDGTYSLRVDHVNDVVWLAPDNEHVPAKWRRKQLAAPNASPEARMQGNRAVQNNDWAKAESLYSGAINSAATLEEARLAHLNRSLANFNLGRFETALSDATKAVQDEMPEKSEKAFFREAKALYGLKRYRECMQKLVVLAKEFPDNQAVKPELGRVQARLREELKGVYTFRQMYKEATAGIPIIDCATFAGPVEVRPSPGRGRGLFTTAAVSAGELLLCEKAFGYCYAGDDHPDGNSTTTILMDMETQNYAVGGQAHLLSQIVQKLVQNPDSSKGFLALHHGAYQAVSADEVDGRPIVDSFLVVKIIMANAFGTPRTSYSSFRSNVLKSEGKVDSATTCGIWILASSLNHSCVGNCRRSFIGDMQIIRATRDMPTGTELLFSYKHAEHSTSFAETQKSLRNWDFQCDCQLCLAKKATTDDALKRRKALLAQLKYIMRTSIDPRSIDTKRALAVLEKIEATYDTPVRTNPTAADQDSARLSTAQITPHLELWDPYFGLGGHLLNMDKKAEAVIVTVKGFEALGFVITATPPPGGGGSKLKKKASNNASDSDSDAGQLLVKSWGMIVDYVVPAFLTLFRAYKATAPELAHKAREYAAIAYSMLVGENETVYDEIPELR